ncbi:MAG: YqaA family protein [Desulfurivibrionaceae bacterium]|nr:YqaA family protein [Desulfurivibrionaceae bacterium]
MPEFLLHNGLPVLFLISFMAATILPLGSEWLLVALILQAHDVGHLVAVATLGNFLGACTTYALGIWGSAFIMEKILRIRPEQVARATRLYQRYGSWSLLLSWLPVIGDPLCLVGGSLRLNFFRFSLLTFSGKLARYGLIASVTAATMG